MKTGSLHRRVWLLTVCFLAALLLCGPALAQGTAPDSGAAPALSSLSIAIWPEYDRPEVLVIYWGEFAPDVALPVSVRWRIPAAVGAPSAVAAVDLQGNKLNQSYTSQVEADWLVLSFELSTRTFQIEYYAPYVTTGEERSFAFTYPGDYPVTAFSLEAQAPRTAQSFALEPAAASTRQGEDGLTYYQVLGLSCAQGESRSWAVRYVKSDSALSLSATEPSEATVAAPAGAPGGGGNSTVWIFLIAFIALVAVGAGAFWLGRRATGPAPSEGGEAELAFCHVCGARLPKDARFCPKCSSPVRGR
jgi:hypothetical protein